MWVLTRQRFPDPGLIRKIYSKIRFLGLDTRRLKKTEQKNCDGALKRENDGDIFDEDSSLGNLKPQGREFTGDDNTSIGNVNSAYNEDEFNFVDNEGPNFNGSTPIVGHDHPFQTGFESRGPSYWPPAK